VCGNPLSNRCCKCGVENAPSSAFCEDCGAALSGNAAPISTSSPQASSQTPGICVTAEQTDASLATDGERKTVTALFADIKGSTELARDLDPEETRALVDPVLQLMMAAVHRYDGYVAQSTGDGVFALFGAPAAHEDHAQRAVHAALAMQEELRRHADKLKNQGRPSIQVRIGMNTGEVVLRMVHTGGHTEYAPVGYATNLAARMQSLAPAGGVVISDDTRRLVEGYFELRDLGPTEVKGISEPINVYEVTGEGLLRGHFELAARRGLTKFVGRSNELEQMRRTLELVLAGHGQIVAAVGEAGAGKSRLVYEFKATLPSESKVLEAYSVSHGRASAYLPVLELLYSYFEIRDADEKAQRRGKIEARLNSLDPALNDTLPLLYTLMGLHEGPDPIAQMDPQIKCRRTLDVIKRIILRESLNQPTVVIFEDLHWIDGETQASLDLLADSIANARVLMLINYRPEYRHDWTNKSYYSQFRLEALDDGDSAEMLSALLGDGVELTPLKRLVIERTEGNPFFIEEMVQELLDEGALMRNGSVKVVRSLSQLRLPATVQGILAARIDRLAPAQKDLLQTLAVMGKESPLPLISQVASHVDVQLEQMLVDLQAGEFIYEQPALAGIGYTFKHALTQEVAYTSLLIGRRRQLHERVGAAIEALYPDSLDDHLADLANHYSRSPATSKAIDYLRLAAQQAVRRAAYIQAISFVQTALERLRELSDPSERMRQELTLRLALGESWTALKGYTAPDAEHAYIRARALAEQTGDAARLNRALFGLWLFHHHRLELHEARKIAEQRVTIAQALHNGLLELNAVTFWSYTLAFLGEYVLASDRLEKMLSSFDSPESLAAVRETATAGYRAAVGVAGGVLALSLLAMGYFEKALYRISAALKAVRTANQPYTLAASLPVIGEISVDAGYPDEGLNYAEELAALSSQHGFSVYSAVATVHRGAALIRLGRADEGVAEMRRGMAAYAACDARTIDWMFAFLAEGLLSCGRVSEGLQVVAEGLASAEAGHGFPARLYRIKAELLLRQGESHHGDAERLFRAALQLAGARGAKLYGLEAAVGLARMLSAKGRREEGRTILSHVYSTFTEGFAFPPLTSAKAFLDRISN
jgi:class 3 adenylate cyclase